MRLVTSKACTITTSFPRPLPLAHPYLREKTLKLGRKLAKLLGRVLKGLKLGSLSKSIHQIDILSHNFNQFNILGVVLNIRKLNDIYSMIIFNLSIIHWFLKCNSITHFDKASLWCILARDIEWVNTDSSKNNKKSASTQHELRHLLFIWHFLLSLHQEWPVWRSRNFGWSQPWACLLFLKNACFEPPKVIKINHVYAVFVCFAILARKKRFIILLSYLH